MKKFTHLLFYVVAGILYSCTSEPSLQKYFVEKSQSTDFVALDISPSILNLDPSKLTITQREALSSFEKVNILAFKLNEKNKMSFEKEHSAVKKILNTEKYQQLMKFGSGREGISVSCIGEGEHIDEFVLFANQNESGFAVVRVLGEDMNATTIFNMISILKEANLDLDQLKPLQFLVKN